MWFQGLLVPWNWTQINNWYEYTARDTNTNQYIPCCFPFKWPLVKPVSMRLFKSGISCGLYMYLITGQPGFMYKKGKPKTACVSSPQAQYVNILSTMRGKHPCLQNLLIKCFGILKQYLDHTPKLSFQNFCHKCNKLSMNAPKSLVQDK